MEEAFGHYDDIKREGVPKGELPAATKEGDVLEDRAGQQATAAQFSDTFAIMDYDYPLAGRPLTVKLTILRVDDPSYIKMNLGRSRPLDRSAILNLPVLDRNGRPQRAAGGLEVASMQTAFARVADMLR